MGNACADTDDRGHFDSSHFKEQPKEVEPLRANHFPTEDVAKLDVKMNPLSEAAQAVHNKQSKWTQRDNQAFLNYDHGGPYKYLADGATYEGQYRNGKKNGLGTWRNGLGEYSGNWVNGQRHGQGREIENNGTMYTGPWVNNLQNGLGVELTPDGTIYTGAWVQGKKHGKGEYKFPDKAYYKGDF
jgi:hypothetical protein